MPELLDIPLTVCYADARIVEDIPIVVWEERADSEATNQITCDRDEDQDSLPAHESAQAGGQSPPFP